MKAPESTVILQEGMILDCLCPWTGQLTMVSWTKKSLKQPLAVYHPQYGTNFASSYDGRVEFLKTTAMDGSISIRNVTESDIGHYHCSLQTYPQGSWTKDTFVEKTGECSAWHFSTLQMKTGNLISGRPIHFFFVRPISVKRDFILTVPWTQHLSADTQVLPFSVFISFV